MLFHYSLGPTIINRVCRPQFLPLRKTYVENGGIHTRTSDLYLDLVSICHMIELTDNQHTLLPNDILICHCERCGIHLSWQ